MILGPLGQPLNRRLELDPQARKGAVITAPKDRPTVLLVDGTADEIVLPPGTQWHLVPEWLWLSIQRELVALERTLRDRGEDAADRGPALAAEMVLASHARSAQEGK